MDPLRKVQDLASSSAALTVLIFASLFLGLFSQNWDYDLAAPTIVSVQCGLCVHIPCHFTYDQRHRTTLGKLYAYWFLKHDGYWHFFAPDNAYRVPGILVATNDERQEFKTSVKNRFQLTGEPEDGDCSFSMLYTKSEDAGEYYFQIWGGKMIYNYLTQKVQVLVTEFTEKPQIQAYSVVLSGKESVYTCSTLGSCIKPEPTIFWNTVLTGYKVSRWSQQHTNGSWIAGSDFIFTPSLKDHGKLLTCRVWYPDKRTPVENSIQLDIADPPKTVEISTNATDRRHLALCSQEAKGDLDSAVAQEGESISLQCKAESRPLPVLSWKKGNKTFNGSHQGREHRLLLAKVRPEDAGEYQCQAETPYGSAKKTLQFCVQYAPRLSSRAQGTSTCQHEDNDLLCTCSLHSWPPPQIQWQVDGETLNKSIPGQPLEVTFQAQGNELTSTLNWTGSQKGDQSIVCVATNPSGSQSLQFALGSSVTTTHDEVLRSSTTFLVIVLFLIKVLFCFLFFALVIWFSNWRKAPPREKQCMMGVTSAGWSPTLPSSVKDNSPSQMFKEMNEREYLNVYKQEGKN